MPAQLQGQLGATGTRRVMHFIATFVGPWGTMLDLHWDSILKKLIWEILGPEGELAPALGLPLLSLIVWEATLR
jgi:hypothetical protein